MASSDNVRHLEIRKYPNRRFYDATRSRHVTLEEMHGLVAEGYELRVTDSQSGDDITNAVLLQILLEKDLPKLAVFPSGILHLLIRTQHQLLAPVVEQYLRRMADMQRATTEQWVSIMRRAMPGAGAASSRPGGASPGGAFDWTGAMMPGWGAGTPEGSPEAGRPEEPKEPEEPRSTSPPRGSGGQRGRRKKPAGTPPETSDDEMRALREQIAELNRKVGRLSRRKK